MAMQLYNPPGGDSSKQLVPVGQHELLSEEERQRRIEEANVLEEKLKFITEKIPTRIMNVAGSNAGAGSGEFHQYRMARRREMMRQSRIEEEATEEDAQREYEERVAKAKQELEDKTAKKRLKRLKKKGKKKAKVATDGLQGIKLGDTAEEDGSDVEMLD